MESETAKPLDLPIMTPSVSLAAYSAAAPECVPEPEPLKPKQAEKDEDADEDDQDEDEDEEEETPPDLVEMIGILSLQPFKMLRGPNRVMMGPGEIVPALMEVDLDNGEVIILDGYVGVVHGQFVVNADQMLQGRDLMLGMTPQIAVDGLLAISPETLENTAHHCGILSVPVEIDAVPNLMIKVTPQFGPSVEPTRYMVVSNDLPVHAKGLFQAHAVQPVQHTDFGRQQG
jgi:hypothetical protein